MKNLRCFTIIMISLLGWSCNNNETERQIENLQAERDSLLSIVTSQDSARVVLDSYMEAIASSIDSIKQQEGILTLSVNPETGKKYSRKEIQQNLMLLQNIIHRQKDRIAELESRIRHSPDSSTYYHIVISQLHQQIEEKESQIVKLQQEVKKRDVQIHQMGEQITSLNEVNQHQTETIQMQEQVLKVQDSAANTAFVLIASKKELRSKGILTFGKVNYNNLKQEDFTAVDMREFTEVTISSGRVKILTPVSSDAYSLTKIDKSTTCLTITNPGVFWSVSSYLIIQIN